MLATRWFSFLHIMDICFFILSFFKICTHRLRNQLYLSFCSGWAECAECIFNQGGGCTELWRQPDGCSCCRQASGALPRPNCGEFECRSHCLWRLDWQWIGWNMFVTCCKCSSNVRTFGKTEHLKREREREIEFGNSSPYFCQMSLTFARQGGGIHCSTQQQPVGITDLSSPGNSDGAGVSRSPKQTSMPHLFLLVFCGLFGIIKYL